MIGRQITAEALRFALVGVAATALHYGIYYALLGFVPAGRVYVSAAYAVGYVLSFVFNFFATSLFTFRERPSWRRLAGMTGAHAVNFVLHLALLNVAVLFMTPAVAPVAVYAVAVPVNFLLVRLCFKRL